MAGFLPGVSMGLLLMVVSYVISKRRNYPRLPRAGLREISHAFVRTIFPLLAPGIILGGIYSGAFTATEAAMVATIYAIMLGVFVFKKFKLQRFSELCLRVIQDSAIAMFILSTATAFNWILTREQIPMRIAESVLTLSQNPYVMLLIINIFFLILGCFMENTAILIIFTPILLPIVTSLGISPVHFGVIFVLNIMIGTLTPPFGIVLYMASAVSKLTIGQIARPLMPFIAILIVNLLLVTYIPQVSLFLPNYLLGR